MYKRIKIKLYPTFSQKQVLEKHFSAFRFIYNLSLEYKITLWKHYGKNISKYDIAKEVFSIRKETSWLSECKAECLREAVFELDRSYKNFFNGRGFPRFKSKKGEQSFHAYQSIYCKENKLIFFKQSIKYKTSKNYENVLNCNHIKQVTFKRDKCGDYWATCLLDLPAPEILPKNLNVIGVDLGIKDLVVTSEAVVYENKKFFKSQQNKIKRLQTRFNKCKNKEKIRIKLSKMYRKISRQKEYYYHKISNDLIRENQTIILESLRIKNMMNNKSLANAISDASWGMLVKMLEYKAKWYGRNIIKIDTFYPSSKTCSKCGHIKESLKLSERTYKCTSCGAVIDRDLNASINIRNAGIKIPEVPVEEVTIVTPKKQELTDLITY